MRKQKVGNFSVSTKLRRNATILLSSNKMLQLLSRNDYTMTSQSKAEVGKLPIAIVPAPAIKLTY
jgi:hypothetical protein